MFVSFSRAAKSAFKYKELQINVLENLVAVAHYVHCVRWFQYCGLEWHQARTDGRTEWRSEKD